MPGTGKTRAVGGPLGSQDDEFHMGANRRADRSATSTPMHQRDAVATSRQVGGRLGPGLATASTPRTARTLPAKAARGRRIAA